MCIGVNYFKLSELIWIINKWDVAVYLFFMCVNEKVFWKLNGWVNDVSKFKN